MEDPQPLLLNIIALEGLRLLRAEKAWRPIVTIDVDGHHSHETTLGIDGQCVNRKETFEILDFSLASQVEVNIWQRSQSKKKGKRRNLVASATHSVGELLRKQELESKVQIRLLCRNCDNKSTANRGRPQNGACLRIRLRPPASVLAQRPSEIEQPQAPSTISGTPNQPTFDHTSHPPSECSGSSTWASPTIETIDLPDQVIRRRIRGYTIDTDEDPCSSEGGYHSEEKSPMHSKFDNHLHVNDDDMVLADSDPYASVNVISSNPLDWAAASLLPVYTEKVEVSPPLNRAELVLAKLTMYSELKTACTDSHYDAVFRRLQLEWTYMGGLLVALAAVNTAVFSISPGSIFIVDSYARSAVAASSIASGLGIACDAWFLLRYNWADLQTFKNRSKDLYDSYFFFSLSSRVPALCMFISAISLMGFLGLVAFDVWPQGVIAVCFIVGLIMTLQFFVYGAHWCATRIVDGGRAGTRHIGRVMRSMTL